MCIRDRVNKNVTDPNHPKAKIAYWTGRVKDIISNKDGQEPSFLIEWDIQTMRKISKEIIKESVENNQPFQQMELPQKAVGINFKPKKWNEKEDSCFY